MAFYELFFSPTGGTRKAADALSSAWSEEAHPIDLFSHPEVLSSLSLSKSDICLVAVPSYGGRVPDLAVRHLHTLSGHGASAILLAVYGNRHIDDTLMELSDILTRQGFSCIAGVEAVAEHSLAHQIAEGRPNEADGTILMEFSRKIRNNLETGTLSGHPSLPGSHDYRVYGGCSVKPYAADSCTRCGKCAQECPVHAIPADDPTVTDPTLCISCMHCVAICPEHARKPEEAAASALAEKLSKVCSIPKENKLYL